MLSFFTGLFLECVSSSILLNILFWYSQNRFQVESYKVGWLISSMAAVQVIGNTLVGTLADRYDRKYVMAAVFLYNSVFSLLFAIVDSFNMLLIFRAIAGLSGTTPPLAFTYVSSKGGNEMYGYVGAVNSAGFMIGTAIVVGLELSFGKKLNVGKYCFFFASALSCLASLIICFFAENSPPEKENSKEDRTPSASDALPQLTRVQRFFVFIKAAVPLGLLFLWCSRFMASWAQMSISSTLSPLAKSLDQSTSLRIINTCNFVGGGVSFLVQGLLFRVLEKKYGPATTLFVGSLFICIALSGYLTVLGNSNQESSPTIRSLFKKSVFPVLGNGVLWIGAGLFDSSIPAINAIKKKEMNLFSKIGDVTGLMNGLVMSVRSFAQILCPLISTKLIDNHRMLLYSLGLSAAITSLVSASFIRRNPLAV
jgi:MFS family permease